MRFIETTSFQTLSSICDDIDVGGGQRVSMVTAIPSSIGSFLSSKSSLIRHNFHIAYLERAGEHLAELSTSEDYQLNENSIE